MRVYAEADGYSPQDGLELVAPALIGSKRCPAGGEQPGGAAASAWGSPGRVRGAGLDTVYQCDTVLPGDAGWICGWHGAMGLPADDVWDPPVLSFSSQSLSTSKSTPQ